jgi:hypothetical protein
MDEFETENGRGYHAGGSSEVSRQYDWSSVSPSTAVVEAVSAATGRDGHDLEPLYETVDPDAFDALVGISTDGEEADIEVRFNYAGCHVTIRGDGEVRSRPSGVSVGRRRERD